MPAGLVLGLHVNDFEIVGNGTLVVLHVDATKASQLIGVRDIRVTLDTLRAVLFGTCEVLEIELGEATEEIRLVKIRLGRDDHVEALNTEHIILVVERIATHHHHTVGVDLSKQERWEE